jgi:hypothetical protein
MCQVADVALYKLKLGIGGRSSQIFTATSIGERIIDNDVVVVAFEHIVHEVATNKTGSPCH